MTRERPSPIVAAIDGAELAVRIAEAVMGLERPPGSTAIDAMERLDRAYKAQGIDWKAGAAAAVLYVRDCLRRADGIKDAGVVGISHGSTPPGGGRVQ